MEQQTEVPRDIADGGGRKTPVLIEIYSWRQEPDSPGKTFTVRADSFKVIRGEPKTWDSSTYKPHLEITAHQPDSLSPDRRYAHLGTIKLWEADVLKIVRAARLHGLLRIDPRLTGPRKPKPKAK